MHYLRNKPSTTAAVQKISFSFCLYEVEKLICVCFFNFTVLNWEILENRRGVSGERLGMTLGTLQLHGQHVIPKTKQFCLSFHIFQRKIQHCFLTVVNFRHEEITLLTSGSSQYSSSDKIFPHPESTPPAHPWLFEQKQHTSFNFKTKFWKPWSWPTKPTRPLRALLCDKNTTGSLALSQPRLCLHSAGSGIWKCLARLCTHWELSDNSHFKLFWYQLCGELPFPWEHDLPLGSGACCTARRINRGRGGEGRGKTREGWWEEREREHGQCVPQLPQ